MANYDIGAGVTVYVDHMKASFGRMKMCHCWADTREELFQMMRLIGVQLKWFQRPFGDCDFGMDASWEHFDISMSKRALVLKNGGVEACKYTMSEHANMQNFHKAVALQQWQRAEFSLRKAQRAVMCRIATI